MIQRSQNFRTLNTLTAIHASSCYFVPIHTVQNYFIGGYINVIVSFAAHWSIHTALCWGILKLYELQHVQLAPVFPASY